MLGRQMAAWHKLWRCGGVTWEAFGLAAGGIGKQTKPQMANFQFKMK
jgi:hypothetical protein